MCALAGEQMLRNSSYGFLWTSALWPHVIQKLSPPIFAIDSIITLFCYRLYSKNSTDFAIDSLIETKWVKISCGNTTFLQNRLIQRQYLIRLLFILKWLPVRKDVLTTCDMRGSCSSAQQTEIWAKKGSSWRWLRGSSVSWARGSGWHHPVLQAGASTANFNVAADHWYIPGCN